MVADTRQSEGGGGGDARHADLLLCVLSFKEWHTHTHTHSADGFSRSRSVIQSIWVEIFDIFCKEISGCLAEAVCEVILVINRSCGNTQQPAASGRTGCVAT